MEKYIILTNKKDEFSTDLTVEGIEPVESYDYFFYSEKKANYTIAKLLEDHIKVKLVEAEDETLINRVPAKLFETFDSLDDARGELQELISFGTMDTKLVKVS